MKTSSKRRRATAEQIAAANTDGSRRRALS
jgi:hypothetical protein